MTRWWPNKTHAPNISFDRSALGDDLDAYLAASEAKVANLRPGLQKQIVRAGAEGSAKPAYSLIYIHGFSASSGEIRPVPDLVARHLRANLYLARLNGHGTDGESLGRATIEAWIDDVAEAIAIGERLGERVIVMATSTGAALATWALSTPALAGKIAAAVLLSPNYALQARGAFLLSSPFARQIVHALIGKTRGFEPVNDEHARIWTHLYSTDALLPMATAMALANRADVAATNVPALFVYSPHDKTVDPRRILSIAGKWGAAHALLPVDTTGDPSAHVLAGDVLAPANTGPVSRAICKWLDRTLAAAP